MAHYRKLQPYWASPSPVPAYSQQKVWGHHAPPVGSTPIVVGSTAQMAKAFLKTYNVAIADRPKLAAGKYTAYYYSNITWSQYGSYWKVETTPQIVRNRIIQRETPPLL
ncbi:hypothetical protein S83_028233 [Arachis hypogaea]